MDENEKDKKRINEILQAAQNGEQQKLKKLITAYAKELNIEPVSMIYALRNILKHYNVKGVNEHE